MNDSVDKKYNKILPKIDPLMPSTFWSRNKKLIIIVILIVVLIWIGVNIYAFYFKREILPQILNLNIK